MNKIKLSFGLIGILALFSACNESTVSGPADATTPTGNNSPTQVLTDEQALRASMEGSYTSDHCSNLPDDMSGSYILLMPYFNDFSNFNISIPIHSDPDCASDPIGLIEIPAKTTFGAVAAETDQSFTTKMDYLGEQVEVQKMNITYLGVYITVYADEPTTIFGVAKSDGKVDISDMFLQGKEKEFGALYRIDKTHFATNMNMRDPEAKITPDARTTEEITDTIWAKQ